MDLSYADGWRPEEGATLVGKVVSIDSGSSNYGGGTYPIVTVQPEGGGDPVAVHCFHAALKSRMMEARPNIGERIGIKFVGKRQHRTDPSLTVADYIVRVERQDAGNVWDRMEGRTPPTPAPAPRTDVPVDASDFAPAQQPLADDDIPF